jgi:hypothetical protein
MKRPRSARCVLVLVLALFHAGTRAQDGTDTSCTAVGDIATARIHEEVMARLPAGYESAAAYQEAIRGIESEHGKLDPQLFPLLLGLALEQREEERHAEAARTLYHALFVVRANEGLYSLTQVPVLELLIDSRTKLNDWRAVADAHDLLIWVYRRNYAPDDPRMLPALKRLRRWNFEAYNKETGRPLDMLFDDAERYYKQGIAIVEKCTGDRQAALCFWHKGCCPGAQEGDGYCPSRTGGR